MVDIFRWFNSSEKPKRKGKYLCQLHSRSDVFYWSTVIIKEVYWNGRQWSCTDGVVGQWKYMTKGDESKWLGR